jgi:hypothetical protein
MEIVGDLYDRNEYFVPEVLMCADALYAGLDILRPHVPEKEDGINAQVVIGSIQGDVHESPLGSGELLRLHWVSLEDAQELALPSITRMVLAEVERRLERGHEPDEPGPFVYFRRGKTVVDQI